ncbi:MAG: type IV secretory system conjugative DNA transfer family protein, partial [Actinomycetota bacterium]
GREATGLGDAREAPALAYRGPSLDLVPGPARFLLGVAGRRSLWCPAEGNVLVLGPARSRKSTGVILPNLRRWPGGCVVTSLRPEAYRWAVEHRAAVGPVRVFDPAGILDAPEAVSWWPWRGAEDWDRAVSVARSMTEGLEDRGTTNSRHFAERAAELLAPILHAAALEAADLRTVRSWVAGHDTARVIAALRLRGAASAADDLAGFHAETEEGSGKAATIATARRALAWAARDRVRRSLDPHQVEPLDVHALFDERATLVMVSPARDQAELAPLMTALLASVVAAGQERAFASPAGRLDPPFAFILDEVATIAPWDGVPELMATGGGFGMPTLAACQDLAQLAARFGPDRAQTVWNNATARLITRGSSDRHTEEAVMRTAGERLGRRRSGGRAGARHEGWQEAWEQVIRPGELSRLPLGTALLLATGARPLHVTLVGDRVRGG